jgi:hypothetical protein
MHLQCVVIIIATLIFATFTQFQQPDVSTH